MANDIVAKNREILITIANSITTLVILYFNITGCQVFLMYVLSYDSGNVSYGGTPGRTYYLSENTINLNQRLMYCVNLSSILYRVYL